jgi:hypothetical protein
MTALLERIARRAREPLSAVEPLAPPPFAAGGADGGPVGSPAPEEPFGELEAMTATEAARPPRAEPAMARRTEAVAGGPARTAPSGDRAALDAAEPRPAARDGRGPRSQAAAAAGRPGRERPDPRATARPLPGDRGPGPARGTPTPEAAGAPRDSRAPVLVPARRAASPDPRPDAPVAHRRPEVTITIGHIEVRAAPAPQPRPAPPPFRPDVSLSEFLARQERRR